MDKGIFLGFSNTSKAYRVFNTRTLVVEESIHVKFNYELMRARLDPSHNRKQKVRINISHAEESTHKTQNGSNRVRCGRRDSDASKMMRQVSCTDEIQKTSSLGLFVDEMVG